MKIINLIENLEGAAGCTADHGLSFYIETEKHKLLVDLGPSNATLQNADKLGVNLTAVDTVVLSHGHYDHSGGILSFAEINPHAAIFLQASAGDDYYSLDDLEDGGQEYRYIGIDKKILQLPQVKWIRGDFQIDDGLCLYTIEERAYEVPFSNHRMRIRQGEAYVQDDFSHEQFLVIREGDKSILFSGCAHNGILNIMAEYKRKTGCEPDMAISGFHLMKDSEYTGEEIRDIKEIARELQKYHTIFYTCHCTSVPAFDIMKEVMGDKLRYVHSGDEIVS